MHANTVDIKFKDVCPYVLDVKDYEATC